MNEPVMPEPSSHQTFQAAELLETTTQQVRRLLRRGDLIDVHPAAGTGKPHHYQISHESLMDFYHLYTKGNGRVRPLHCFRVWRVKHSRA